MKVCGILWGIALCLLTVAAALPKPAHHVESEIVYNAMGIPLSLVVYVPEPPPRKPAPAAVLCQPMNNPPDFSGPLALELVRQGFIVATFDWGGQAPEQNRQLIRANLQAIVRSDALAAVNYLKARQDVDANRIAVAGHSVGANLAIDAGIDDPTVVAVACIGMAREVEGASPANLLWVAGLYDEFWPPASLASAYQGNVGSAPRDLMYTETDFAGTRRALAVSPTADHFTEMLDWRLQRAVADWFLKTMGIGKTTGVHRTAFRNPTFTLGWLSALVAALVTLRRLLSGRVGLLRGILAAILVAIVLLDAMGTRDAADVVLYLIATALLSGAVSRSSPEALHKAWRVALRVGLVLWGSVVLTLCLNAVPTYLREPRFLVFIPEFILRHLLDWLYAYLLLYSRQLLFAGSLPDEIVVRGWVYCLLAVETISPGLLLRLASGVWGIRSARQPKSSLRLPAGHIAVLGLLILVLAAMVWLRLGQGFITKESLLAAARFILRFGIVPVAAFAALWRLCKRFWPLHAA